MYALMDLPEAAARHAIEHGEFPQEIIGTGRVAVVMTQNWCVEWLMMKSWLKRTARNDRPDGIDASVYVLVYNQVSFFREFMEHKEEVFGNQLIPYVRYYRDGTLTGESNAVGANRFAAILSE